MCCAMRSGRVPARLGRNVGRGRNCRNVRTCAVRSNASSAAVAPPGTEQPARSCLGSPPESSPSTDAFAIDLFFGNVGVDANRASKLRFGKDSSPSAVKQTSASSDSESCTGRGHAAMVIAGIPSVACSFRTSDSISVRRLGHTARAPCNSTPRGASATTRAWVNKRSQLSTLKVCLILLVDFSAFPYTQRVRESDVSERQALGSRAGWE